MSQGELPKDRGSGSTPRGEAGTAAEDQQGAWEEGRKGRHNPALTVLAALSIQEFESCLQALAPRVSGDLGGSSLRKGRAAPLE